MLKVWGRRNSFNVQKVLWLVGELGLDYEHIPAGGKFGRLDEPAFRALNPHGKIPVVEDGDVAVWESHAILRYLAARYGEESFWGQNPAARAPVDGWMDWAQSALQPTFLNGVFLGYFRTPEAERNWPAINKSLEQCASLFGLVDRILADRPYLLGDELSLADIPAGTTLYRYFELDIERPSLPNVEGWYRRLQQRPAYREHVMVSFQDMRA
ncbi:glutathione S-transferase family protein [Telmatospirillum siberiense]|uniref:Glutathione S-transferase n=1 Tax=Telmatospirillum siberiense TaxID=382514 RepID=A0A2N3PM84_9PROT|nr:glutathione S-transferase [Telmatospirillum siberiense]PKU21504.1 glutathione S-transferase [Telmatospirillum siberiense]